MKLVIELKILPVDKKGRSGVTTFHEASRALRALCRDFDAEAGGAELEWSKGKGFYPLYDYDSPEKVEPVVGKWKVTR